MKGKLTESVVKAGMPNPDGSQRLIWNTEIPGFSHQEARRDGR